MELVHFYVSERHAFFRTLLQCQNTCLTSYFRNVSILIYHFFINNDLKVWINVNDEKRIMTDTRPGLSINLSSSFWLKTNVCIKIRTNSKFGIKYSHYVLTWNSKYVKVVWSQKVFPTQKKLNLITVPKHFT